MPREHLQHRAGVADAPREGADGVQRRRERDQAVAADPTVRRLQPDDAAERRRLAHAATGVGSQRPHRLAGRHRGGGPAARATRHPVEVPRVVHRPVRGVLVRGAHRELVAVGLADEHRTGARQSRPRRRVVRRHVALEDLRTARGPDPVGREHVLDGDRDAGHGRLRRPGGQVRVQLARPARRPAAGSGSGTRARRRRPPRSEPGPTRGSRSPSSHPRRAARTAPRRSGRPTGRLIRRSPRSAAPGSGRRRARGRCAAPRRPAATAPRRSSRKTLARGIGEAVGGTSAAATSPTRAACSRIWPSWVASAARSSSVRARRASFATCSMSISTGMARSLDGGRG